MFWNLLSDRDLKEILILIIILEGFVIFFGIKVLTAFHHVCVCRFFLAVEIKPSILAYISVPLKVRKQFDIFCLIFAGLMSLSARLFVNGTSLLKANASTASFP